MATRSLSDRMFEDCPECGGETEHTVHIELLTESKKRENAVYSREPYRVTTCHVCGTEQSVRMNDV